MDFNEALQSYTGERTKENLDLLSKQLTDEMSLHEKLYMLRGHAMGATVSNFLKYRRVYNATPYGAGGCERLGIPEIRFTDGPRGIVMGKCTCFPVSMLRGAAFDDELEYRIGCAMAKEGVALGANYFAGICINLLRHPAWGRAQECYGEDPCLTGRMGSALTRAVRDSGMIACPKHFAMNSIEDLRFSVNAQADERTLREVYLPHFRKCIDAGALSVMGAYNRVNGDYCCENKTLLTKILRDEWGFDGFTISDFFFGIYSASKALKAGLDIEMPYTFKYSSLASLLKRGKIGIADIDKSVRRIISVLLRTQEKLIPADKESILCREHTELSLEAARKGTVLLRNEDRTLPLPANSKIAVVGRYADRINVGDHGSSNVFSPYTVTAYEGLCNKFGRENVFLSASANIDDARKAAANASYVVVNAGSDYTQEGEFLVNLGNIKKKPAGSGGDRVSLRLPGEDVQLILAMSAAGKKVIVNIMGGSAYVISEWEGRVHAVLHSFYSGLEGGNALADILSGDVNPSGHLPFTMAKYEQDYPEFRRIGDNTKDITYGCYHGYTLFEHRGTSCAHEFGFGLSYTEFSVTGTHAAIADGALKVTAQVSNTGKRDGETVVQIYIGSCDTQKERPLKLLKDFKRVALSAGETKETSFIIPLEDIKFYDPMLKDWEADSEYNVYAGLSSSCESFARVKI